MIFAIIAQPCITMVDTHAHTTSTKERRGYLLELCPLDWPVAELAVALEALELGLLLSGGEFALCLTCSDCNL